MAEPFKNLVNADGVRDAARQLQCADPAFDAARFEALATEGLQALELKARAMQVCRALEATLPADFHAAAALIEAALGPPLPVDDEPAAADAQVPSPALAALAPGLRGWILWSAGEYIARHGQDAPERALQALHAITQRFTAEFAIRPFIVQHPALSFATLQRWCDDPSAHVRRLVSEGSRPRLPWGQQLKALINDPTPTLPLLRALQDDRSTYVRRSVANHLNDVAKDHPALVAQWLQAHLPGADAQRRALLRHASRTLIKQGDAAVLQAWGLGGRWRGQATLQLTPACLALGDTLTLSLHLQSTAARAQTLVIDYAVHHVKASGSRSAKVFKGWQMVLPPRGEITLIKRHSMRAVTTRRYHAGRHAVHVQVNGQVVAQAEFDLVVPADGAA